MLNNFNQDLYYLNQVASLTDLIRINNTNLSNSNLTLS